MTPETAPEVPPAVVARLRAICLALPEAHEQPAWVGTRWRIRTRTFAHVLPVDEGRPPVFARAAGTDGRADLLTFRAAGQELEVLRAIGHPFFAPPWPADSVGLILGDGTDWTEVAELLTESYRALAPKRLAESVDGPPPVRPPPPAAPSDS
ncbi:hypothetical protein DSM112329_01746 [Paraconexibacter sp. AEG42_29]|uniref:MmcQ/YjbR family DNA-binding protein n=1 Tax=Paraconexibacter sp. AEG42_29 TaxID=2997339 RepID=A0AAU7ATH9_9ACTN